MKISRIQLHQLMPKIVKWAEAQAKQITAGGDPLNAEQVALAHQVGVTHPDRVRVQTVQKIPMPTDPILRSAAQSSGLCSPSVVGMTFGYSICLRNGWHRSIRLLSHELRHVHQFEKAGTLGQIIPAHLNDVLTYGPIMAPHEIDARAFEVID